MGLLAATIIALFSTSSLIFLLSTRAHHVGLVDSPCERKIHESDIPTIGGIAIICGYLLSLFFAEGSHINLYGFALPALLLVGVGALDDIIHVSYKVRFAAQIVAGLVMTLVGGVVIGQLGELLEPGWVISLGVFAVPFTIFFLMGLVNAFNMSDGIDGLAGSLALVALLGLGVVAYMGGQIRILLELFLLGACLIAFLMFNARFPWRKNAFIYLGDSGSTFLGFALLWFAITMTQGEQAVMASVTPLWFFALPLFDMTTVFIRRLVNKQHPFEAHREHLHHMFLTAGFSVGHTVLMIGLLALLLAIVGIAGEYSGIPDHVMLALFFASLAGYYYVVAKSWASRRFLGRMICRRSGKNRRLDGQQDQESFQGDCQRYEEDRRDISD